MFDIILLKLITLIEMVNLPELTCLDRKNNDIAIVIIIMCNTYLVGNRLLKTILILVLN